ncbi:MAG: hypothetical protein ACHQRM_01050 [Bacteroidia bacterium]
MKHIKYIIFTMLASLSFSCTKEKLNDSMHETPLGGVLNADKTPRLVNPFEELGIFHNAALDYEAKQNDFPRLTEERIYDLLYPFINRKYPCVKWSNDQLKAFHDQNEQLVNAGSNATTILAQEGKIDKMTKELLDELYAIVFYGSEPELTLTPLQMNERVGTFEQNVMRKYGVPAATLTPGTSVGIVLGAASIARNSYKYWYEALHDIGNPWYDVLRGDSTKNKINWRNVWMTIKADFLGFCGHCGDGNGGINLVTGVEGAIDESASV